RFQKNSIESISLLFPGCIQNLSVPLPYCETAIPCPFPFQVYQFRNLAEAAVMTTEYEVSRDIAHVQQVVLQARVFKKREDNKKEQVQCEYTPLIPVNIACNMEPGQTYRILCISTSREFFSLEAQLEQESAQDRADRIIVSTMDSRLI
ncbi:MAG: hypothetical protein JSS62_04905, partial [Verrucomicrobia bacterium]|nr:hypothetical protein [Verrucomicrobiota bacterium]